MQKTKILITALALTLCTLSFASCGNGNVEESGSTAPGSTTESTAKETESRVETTTERPGTTTTESTAVSIQSSKGMANPYTMPALQVLICMIFLKSI